MELEAQVAELTAQVAALMEEGRELKARVGQNSSNSSRPPSSDPPWAPPPKPPRAPSGRKQGAQPGHPGRSRDLLPPEKVDKVVAVLPKRCKGCAAGLPAAPEGTELEAPARHQVVEIPKAVAYVTEYQLFALPCPACGEVTRAELPGDVPSGCVGARLQAAASTLTGRYRLSRREAGEALGVLFGEKAEVSVGTIVELERQTSDALATPYEEAVAAVRRAEVAYADETGWWVRAKRAWLWIAVTVSVAVFRVDPKRSRDAFKRLLGAFAGILVTDRWSAYAHHALELRQICWAHLKRDFQKLVDRGGEAAKIGNWGLSEVARLFACWKDFQAGVLDRPGLGRRLLPVKARLGRLLRRGAASGDRKARALARELQKLWPALWTFARAEGVEPTNNRAERGIRPAVLWRKGSFGTASDEGNRFVERMLTTVQTMRLQGRPVLDYLEQAIWARRLGKPPPSLLPPASTGGAGEHAPGVGTALTLPTAA